MNRSSGKERKQLHVYCYIIQVTREDEPGGGKSGILVAERENFSG
jgi:hypothetical protein